MERQALLALCSKRYEHDRQREHETARIYLGQNDRQRGFHLLIIASARNRLHSAPEETTNEKATFGLAIQRGHSVSVSGSLLTLGPATRNSKEQSPSIATLVVHLEHPYYLSYILVDTDNLVPVRLFFDPGLAPNHRSVALGSQTTPK